MTPLDTEDMANPVAFEFVLEYGNEHFANIVDRIQERLNKNRARIETLLNEINTRTKANILQSILGLGQISRQQQHMELSDMLDIVNLIEAELRNVNMDDITHRTRGQHPEAWNHHG
eukprot:2082887-Heterocapsa_arctica.AAC.1